MSNQDAVVLIIFVFAVVVTLVLNAAEKIQKKHKK